MKLKIEQSLIISGLKLHVLKKIAADTNKKNLAAKCEAVEKLLPNFLIGRGGSHIFITNKHTNERLAIIS